MTFINLSLKCNLEFNSDKAYYQKGKLANKEGHAKPYIAFNVNLSNYPRNRERTAGKKKNNERDKE